MKPSILNLLKARVSPLALLEGGLELGMPFMPTLAMQQEYHRTFDPEGKNIQATQDLLDFLRMKYNAGGEYERDVERPYERPLTQMHTAATLMAAPDGIPVNSPYATESMIDAMRNMAREREENKQIRQAWQSNETNWSGLQNLAASSFRNVNAATEKWRKARQSKGLPVTTEDVAAFRKKYRSDFLIPSQGFYRTTIENNPDLYKRNMLPYKIR